MKFNMIHQDFTTSFRRLLFVLIFLTGIFAAAGKEDPTSNEKSVIGPIFQQYIDAGAAGLDHRQKEQIFSTKIQQIRSEAEKGDSKAEFLLGKCYDERWGVQVDVAEAAKWYRKSAEHGNAYGCNNLGTMYADGRGVSKDDTEALKWYRKAADLGNATGCINVGLLYAQGRGVTRDDAEALKWYQKAADLGSAEAKSFLEKYEKDTKAHKEWRARLIDEGSEKFGGPNTETVINLIGSIRTYPNLLIRRGTVLESAGGLSIPAGTTLYPIKIADQKDGNFSSLTYYFYKDSFGDWKAVEVKN